MLLPVIEPDALFTYDFVLPHEDSAAYDLWVSRATTMRLTKDDLVRMRSDESDPLHGFERIVEYATTLNLQELLQLRIDENDGNDISSKLALCGIDRADFMRLLEAHDLLNAANPNPDDASRVETIWDDVYDILLHAIKRTNYRSWRAKEKADNIVLSDEFFQIPPLDPIEFPPPPEPELPALAHLSE